MIKRRSRPLSLILRVMLFVILSIILSQLLIGTLVLTSIKRHFLEQDVGELKVMISAIERVLDRADNNLEQLSDTLSHAVSGHHGVYYQVEDFTGKQLYTTPGIDFSIGPATLTVFDKIDSAHIHSWESGDKTYRGVNSQVMVDGVKYRISSAIDMAFHLKFLANFSESIWLIMVGAGTLTLLAAWFGVRQGLGPLHAVNESMRAVQTNKLDMRLAPNAVPIELQNLVLSFNQMIAQLEQGFTRLSDFSADIAHELRTPLTNCITQIQVSLSKTRSADAYRELLYSTLEEQERLAKMVSDMLWLAKSENGFIKPILTPLDLGLEAKALFEFFEALAEEKKISLVLQGAPVRVNADRDLLRRALTNLLSNAIRHTPEGNSVFVRLSLADDNVNIVIENPGHPIQSEHLKHLFERFYRADPSRQRHSDGTGLGLAIVKSIVEAHSGKIEVESRANTTQFKLTLPA